MTTVKKNMVPPLLALPGLEHDAQLSVISARETHRQNVQAAAVYKASVEADVARNQEWKNDAQRKAATADGLNTPAYLELLETVEESSTAVATAETDAAYYRHMRQVLLAEIDQRKLDSM